MPTYEYVCGKCGHEFEAMHSMTSAPLKVCPADLCAQKKWGRGKVSKKISAGSGLLFKGGGFYITDYRSDNYKQSAKKESGGGETKSAAKTESKAAPAKAAEK